MNMKTRHWLILILALAAILRFYGLSRGDTVNDEVFYGFRAIGLMDFDEAVDQTTPWEWYDPSTSSGQTQIPSWAKISFHDHPPLVFWVQHFSIALFGENNFAMRFPSALLGVISVYLLYLIGKHLYSAGAGLIASALMALTLNSVYISRTGMQEPYVIFFLLLSVYLFLRSLEKENYLLWTGAALGFGFLAKYNVFILVPIFLTYLLFFKREYFLNKKLWIGGGLSLAIFSPVIIYNIKLYQAVGHFDFQFSHIFGQNPEVWKVQPGKEIGTLAERVKNFAPRLISTHSWLFLAAFALSIMGALKPLFSDTRVFFRKHAFLVISFVYLILLLLLIGPSFRFLTMLTPFMALSMALFFDYIYPHDQSSTFSKTREAQCSIGVGVYENFLKNRAGIFAFIFGILLLFEIFYSYNNQITHYPSGVSPWLSSKVRFENYNWGYNALGGFFTHELADKIPAIRFDTKYQFIEDGQDKNIAKARRKNFEPYPAMIVTYGNFDRGAKLWALDRLHVYHGWPVIDLETYFQYLAENGADYYNRVGFRNYYFVLSANIVPSPEFNFLIANARPVSINNPRGDEAFRIYVLEKSF